MAPGAVFYVSTGRKKKIGYFSCEDTARLGNAKDRDEPSALRRRRDSVEGGRPGRDDASGLGGLRPRAATASPLLRRNPGRRGPDPRDSARYEGVPQHTDASVANKRDRNTARQLSRAPET